MAAFLEKGDARLLFGEALALLTQAVSIRVDNGADVGDVLDSGTEWFTFVSKGTGNKSWKKPAREALHVLEALMSLKETLEKLNQRKRVDKAKASLAETPISPAPVLSGAGSGMFPLTYTGPKGPKKSQVPSAGGTGSVDEVPLAVRQPFSLAAPAQQKAPGGTTARTPSPLAVAASADTAPFAWQVGRS